METAAPTTDSTAPASLPFILADHLQQRELVVDDIKHTFPVLVINKPELWRPAEETHATYEMPMPGSGTVIRFPMTGISYKNWEAIEAKYIVPEWQDLGAEPEKFKQERLDTIQDRNLAVLEAGLGKQIPGKTGKEKMQFLNARVPGEIDSLFRYINGTLCNWSAAGEGDLLQRYQELSPRASAGKVIDFKDFTDWQEANKTEYIFRMQRKTDDYIIEIPIRGISRDQKEAIMAQTKETEPPHVPLYNADTGKHERSQSRPNRTDPSWLRKTRTVHQQRTVMYFECCLPFTIPGTNYQEKHEWIASHLVGDVTKLKDFIEEEILSYGSRYKSFMML